MVAYCQTTQFIRLIMTVEILSVIQNQFDFVSLSVCT